MFNLLIKSNNEKWQNIKCVHWEFNIQLRQHTVLEDQQLDQLVEEITRTNRLIGPNSIRARLRQQNVFVTRQRVRQSCTIVDPAIRSGGRPNIERRTYKVARLNLLWQS